MLRPGPPPRVAGAVAAMLLAMTTATGGCGGDDGGTDARRFCDDVRADVAGVVSPSLATPEELEVTLARYRALADVAPPAIEEEWAALLTNLETAATVVADDPDSVQRAVAQAFATERSAVAVADWLRANCAIDIGPVATIVPQGRPAPATTAPGSVPGVTVPLGTEPAG